MKNTSFLALVILLTNSSFAQTQRRTNFDLAIRGNFITCGCIGWGVEACLGRHPEKACVILTDKSITSEAIKLDDILKPNVDTIFFSDVINERDIINPQEYGLKLFGESYDFWDMSGLSYIYYTDSLNTIVPDYSTYIKHLVATERMSNEEVKPIKELSDYNILYQSYRCDIEYEVVGQYKMIWFNSKFRKWKFWTKPLKVVSPVFCRITKIHSMKSINIKDIYSPKQFRKLEFLYPK